MAKYVDAFDLSDPALVITEVHCDDATALVDAALWVHGINPDEVALPNQLLADIAGLWAKRRAAVEGALGDDSPLLVKAQQFQRDALQLQKALSRNSLGIANVQAFGSITLGRG